MLPATPRLIIVGFVSLLVAAMAAAQGLTLKPFNSSGLYALGEKAGWTVELAPGAAVTAGGCTYTLKKNNFAVIKSGPLDLAAGAVTIDAVVDEPAMLRLEVSLAGAADRPILAGAAVAPGQLRPSVPRPADFDAFWAAKIKLLQAVPANPVLTPGGSDTAGVEYATVRLDNLGKAHVYGQLARPARAGKFPALLVFQWAGGPYPLQKSWVTDRAAEGWLALNIEPHDVPGDMPPAFYAALPQLLKEYQAIGNTDRDRSYFLGMYLGAYRAVDYLASRADWDGRTIVVTGISMGGQQSLCIAGLHRLVTHVMVHVPAGCDTNGSLHGRTAGYPNWNPGNPKVMETALYFDPVNFAPLIKATCLVSMGFLDELAPPVGIWIACNQIAAPKEVVPLVEAAHNNQATAGQQRAYTLRAAAWREALLRGEKVDLHGGGGRE